MTDLVREPKIIDGFDYLKFFIDSKWKKIPSQQMLEALVHFPNIDSPDPYRIEPYRQKFNLRNRQYDSKKNQKILRGWSNLLINGYANHWGLPYRLHHLLGYTSKIEYHTHTFEIDDNKIYCSIDRDKPCFNYSPHYFPPSKTSQANSKDIAKIIEWFLNNNLSYEKYVYAEIMGFYCFHILSPTTSRYTAISDNLEIAERKFLRGVSLTPQEHRVYEKRRIFFDSLKRRFPELQDIFPEYEELRQQLLQDDNTSNILNGHFNDARTQIRRDKANKPKIEKELGIKIEIVSQCIFCYKFHYQTTNKTEDSEKTALVRYCPECKEYNRRWEGNKYTPARRNIPLNGW
jgi:hypothetical protein